MQQFASKRKFTALNYHNTVIPPTWRRKCFRQNDVTVALSIMNDHVSDSQASCLCRY